MTPSPRVAVFPGTFDPITNGHLDIIDRARRLFDRLVVAALVNTGKQPLFALDERVSLIRESVKAWPNVEVDTFGGLLVDYVRLRNAVAVVRGVRSAGDFTDESQMALMNRHLNPAGETVLLVSAPEHAHVASRLVREIALVGGAIDTLVPPAVAAAFRARAPRP